MPTLKTAKPIKVTIGPMAVMIASELLKLRIPATKLYDIKPAIMPIITSRNNIFLLFIIYWMKSSGKQTVRCNTQLFSYL